MILKSYNNNLKVSQVKKFTNYHNLLKVKTLNITFILYTTNITL